jgi:hypothetical protein
MTKTKGKGQRGEEEEAQRTTRRRPAAAIASRSPWQQDQHGYNRRQKFSSQCHSRLALGTTLHQHAASGPAQSNESDF